PCTTLVMPPSLVASGALADPRALGIARFLLMLDEDGEPGNGIAISAAVQQIAAGWPQVDFDAADLDAALVTIVSDAVSVDGTAHLLPTATEALVHLEASTSCAYAGAFAGAFAGDFEGAMVLVVGQRRPDVEFRLGAFAWLAYDDSENWEFGGGELFGVELAARPTIRYVNGADTMTASYTTPDRIAGAWNLPEGHHAASFSLARLGPASGEYRFVGWMGGFRQDGALGLSLDGNTVTGEAFDAIRGLRTRVTGSLDGDVMSLGSESQLLTTAVGTVSFDDDGAPASVTGTWGRGGAFHAVACRLD
ncbi:MAG TPA: hypothetical protein VLD39_08385, partial [Gammaproteobacteria bacterium]|nr:hypothetical protein [Gammaproteobacteria bacterium]